MTLPGSNLSLNQVNTELGRSATATIELNDAGVRTLAGVGGSGTTIGMNSLLSKTHTFTVSFSGGVNINLRTTAVNLGWDQVAILYITNNGTISSSSTGSFACFIGDGGFARGCTFTNNAWIVSRGGDGGYGSANTPIDRTPATSYGQHGGTGGTSGPSLGVAQPVTIVNNSAIFSGGGGAGGGGTGKSSWLDGYGNLAWGSSASGGGGGAGRGGGNGGGTGHNISNNLPSNYHGYGAAGGGGSDINGPGSGGNHAATAYADIYGVVHGSVGGHGGTGGGAGSAGAGGGGGYVVGRHVAENLSSYGGGGGPPNFAVYATSAGLISWGGYGTVHGPVHNV
jgi:hypothetical protein